MRLFSSFIFIFASLSAKALEYTLDLRATRHWHVDICTAKNQAPTINFPQKLQAYIEIRAKNARCIAYSLDIEKVINHNAGYVKQYSQTLVSQNDRWLLLPENTPEQHTINLKVLFDEQQSLSTPWREFSEKGLYQAQAKNFDWPNIFVLGKLTNFTYAINPKQQASISFADSISRSNARRLLPWLTGALDATHNFYQRFPQDQVQLVVLPAERGNEPTPFAQVLRGASSSVIFYVQQNYSLNAFKQDWTAYHELSHLLIPFIRRNEAWVSEGLASYLQYYSMAKHQVISKQVFWEKLHAGFKRGAESYRKNAQFTLKQVTPRMFQSGAVRRVYWTGAIIFFELDISLRKERNVTLVSLLDRFNQKYMPSYRMWSAHEFARAMDELSQSSFFTAQFKQWAGSRDYPDHQKSFKSLGVQIRDDGLTFEKSTNTKLAWHNFIAQDSIRETSSD